jgi:tetratricopeptide (TPR) repeat protein
MNLRQRIKTGSQRVDDCLDWASRLIDSGDVDQGLLLHHQALDLPLTPTGRAVVLNSLGDLLFNTFRDAGQARIMADRCVATLSQQTDTEEVLLLRGSAHYLIALCIWQSDPGARAEAIRALEYFERLIATGSSDDLTESALLGAGRVCFLIGKVEEAIAHYNHYLRRDLPDKDRLMGLLELATGYRMNERLAEAEETANAAIVCGSVDSKLLGYVHLELGLIRYQQSRLAQAKRARRPATSRIGPSK